MGAAGGVGNESQMRNPLSVDVDEVTWPDPRRHRPKGDLRRRVLRAAGVAVAAVLVVVGFVIVTGYTGFPAPGPLRRYPNSDLQELADRINALPCETVAGGVEPGNRWTLKPLASVDHLRSRVHLRTQYRVLVPPEDVDLIDNPGDTAPRLGCHP